MPEFRSWVTCICLTLPVLGPAPAAGQQTKPEPPAVGGPPEGKPAPAPGSGSSFGSKRFAEKKLPPMSANEPPGRAVQVRVYLVEIATKPGEKASRAATPAACWDRPRAWTAGSGPYSGAANSARSSASSSPRSKGARP